MPKKESVSALPTAEIRNAILETIRATTAPVTAAQISKLLIAPHKLTERKLSPLLDEFVADGALRTIPSLTAKGKPRFWDRDITVVAREAVVAAMQQAQEPLTAKDVATGIASPIKFTESEVTPILNDQVALQAAHLIPPKTAAGKPRYWKHDLSEFVRIAVLQTLSAKGPQSTANLKKAVKGLTDSQFQQHFKKLIVTQVVIPHPPLGKKGKELFGSQPPMPEPYLKDIGSSLNEVVAQLRSAHVPIENLRRAVIQLMEAAGISFGSNPSSAIKMSAAKPSISIDLVSLMRSIEPAADRGALIPPGTLRNAANMDKTEFDRAVMDLATAGKVSLHRHDYVASLTAVERDELVTDGAGTYYVGLALRQNIESSADRIFA